MKHLQRGDVVFNLSTGRFGSFREQSVAETLTGLKHDICKVSVDNNGKSHDENWKASDTCYDHTPAGPSVIA